MDFGTLITALESGDIDKAKEIATSLKPTFDNTVNELKSFESKFNEAKDGRDKLKTRIKELSEATGLSAEDFVPDKLKELMKSGKNDETLKAEIANLSQMLQSKETEFNGKLNDAETRFTSTLIESEIAKLGAGSNVVNDKALGLVISALKAGAAMEDGKIVYKDANGLTLRNSSGGALSISEKMAEFSADASNAFLFKPTNQGGGGATQNQGQAGAKTMSRTSFESMASTQQMAFVKDGGTLQD